MGDLSLALDPHPPPEAPTAIDSLELSTLEDDGSGEHLPTPDKGPSDPPQLDVTNRGLLKAHLNANDKSGGRYLNI